MFIIALKLFGGNLKKNEVCLDWEFKDIKLSLHDGVLGNSLLGNYSLGPELSVWGLSSSFQVNSLLSMRGKLLF